MTAGSTILCYGLYLVFIERDTEKDVKTESKGVVLDTTNKRRKYKTMKKGTKARETRKQKREEWSLDTQKKNRKPKRKK